MGGTRVAGGAVHQRRAGKAGVLHMRQRPRSGELRRVQGLLRHCCRVGAGAEAAAARRCGRPAAGPGNCTDNGRRVRILPLDTDTTFGRFPSADSDAEDCHICDLHISSDITCKGRAVAQLHKCLACGGVHAADGRPGDSPGAVMPPGGHHPPHILRRDDLGAHAPSSVARRSFVIMFVTVSWSAKPA